MKDIDLGLWDSYLMWNFEAYQNIKTQNLMAQYLTNLPQINKDAQNNIQETKAVQD